MSAYEQKLAEFGRQVLELLHHDKDWGASTLDWISAAAHDLELADSNDEGFFNALQAPAGEKPLCLQDACDICGGHHPVGCCAQDGHGG